VARHCVDFRNPIFSVTRKKHRFLALTLGTIVALALLPGAIPSSLADDGRTTVAAARTPWPKPCRSGSDRVFVSAGKSLQRAMNNHPADTTYCLRPGHHRLAHAIRNIQNGDAFIGQNGDRTVLSGAKLITNWSKQDGLWVATGQKQRNAPEGNSACKPVGSPQCVFPEDVFKDHTRLTRVKSKGDVGPRSFYFDYANDRIRQPRRRDRCDLRSRSERLEDR
jgi:hypothetical protein